MIRFDSYPWMLDDDAYSQPSTPPVYQSLVIYQPHLIMMMMIDFYFVFRS